MARLDVRVIVTVIGEGGSGGALGIGVGDRVLMLENAIFSVISPEGCAAILWKDASLASQAAEHLRLTAYDLQRLGIVDQVVVEPPEGAHTAPGETGRLLDQALWTNLESLKAFTPAELQARRYAKLRAIGLLIRRGRVIEETLCHAREIPEVLEIGVQPPVELKRDIVVGNVCVVDGSGLPETVES
jgi:acetyl-CoA carboxylase carboxyl transferase subunit alpha